MNKMRKPIAKYVFILIMAIAMLTACSTQGQNNGLSSGTESAVNTGVVSGTTGMGDGADEVQTSSGTQVSTDNQASNDTVQESGKDMSEILNSVVFNGELINAAMPASHVFPYNVDFTTTFNNNISQFDNSKWYSKWNEKDVFRMEMKHAQTGLDYFMRIGKGGQIYSIDTPIGEIMPPQNHEHAWVDDCLLLTLNQYDGQDAGNSKYSQGYIHQGGVYQHYDYDPGYLGNKSFFSPVVAERLDTQNKQYATLTWGQMSTAISTNRADVLIYQNNRDMGDGVIEVTYMVYNYNDTLPYKDNTDISAWGGVRTSKLPITIMSNKDGSVKESTANFGQNGHLYDNINTGGWMGACQDPGNPDGYALAYVFGNNPAAAGGANSGRFVTIGRANRDDFTVMSVNYRDKLLSGQAYFFRMYIVFGKLKDVTAKSNELQAKCEYGLLDYKQDTSPTIPLYLEKKGSQTVLADSGSGDPAMYVYAQPVKGSKPLYLLYETATGEYKVTSDPYMLNTEFKLSSIYDKKERMARRPYDGNGVVLKLFGYVMPAAAVDNALSYSRLDSILTDSSYYPKKGFYDKDIMVRVTPN